MFRISSASAGFLDGLGDLSVMLGRGEKPIVGDEVGSLVGENVSGLVDGDLEGDVLNLKSIIVVPLSSLILSGCDLVELMLTVRGNPPCHYVSHLTL